MALSKLEQETIIVYNNAEKTAVVTTMDPALTRKLEAMCAETTDIVRIETKYGIPEYILPKKWVKIIKSRTISDEQRRAMAERMKRNAGGK